MWINYVWLVVLGVGAGAVTATGYFAILSVVGVITRFANFSGTASHIRLYEKVLCLGGVLGNLIWIFGCPIKMFLGIGVLYGILTGIFVGCFLVSLAEMVKGLPLFMRKSGLKKGFSAIIMSLAIGKSLGSIFYFCCYLANK